MGSLSFGAVVCCSYGQTYPSIREGRENRQGRPPDRHNFGVRRLLVHERWLWRLAKGRSPPTICSVVLLRRNLVLLLPLLVILVLLLLMIMLVIHRGLVDVFVVRVLILLSVLHVLCMVLCLRRRRWLLLLLGVRHVLVRMVLPRHRRHPLPASILLLLMSVHCTGPPRGRRPGRPPPDRRALVRRRSVVVVVVGDGQEMSFLRPGTGSSCAAAAADRPPLLLACLKLSVAGPVCRRSHVVGRGKDHRRRRLRALARVAPAPRFLGFYGLE